MLRTALIATMALLAAASAALALAAPWTDTRTGPGTLSAACDFAQPSATPGPGGCDPCPFPSMPWKLPPGDNDCDGFTSAVESYTGTDRYDPCADTANADDERGPLHGEPLSPWPPDINDDGRTTLADVLRFIPVFNTSAPGPPYGPRFDLSANGQISLADVLLYIPFFNRPCVP